MFKRLARTVKNGLHITQVQPAHPSTDPFDAGIRRHDLTRSEAENKSHPRLSDGSQHLAAKPNATHRLASRVDVDELCISVT
ncbi:hypothetical protein QTJ16_005336 [Diplocarpon rosae]|uniref:Uncharacterized protein n=1 Tax=Diplocarpon rosae TaxID=946125 RepID=A0AAD9SXR8_9HELO|nr:hypothetical protein QTJ16_005336 [Diplocarpon rosae]